MKSFSWPDIFKGGRVEILSDKDAIKNNLLLLLGAEKGGLFGDPGFGTLLKRYLYEQNSTVMRDLVREEIYDSIRKYAPQVKVDRTGIVITKNKASVYITMYYSYINENVSDMFSIEILLDE